LLSKGADVNSRDNDGRTPLHLAYLSGHVQVAELLLSKGADVNSKDNDGRTPIYYIQLKELTRIPSSNVYTSFKLDEESSKVHTPSNYQSLGGKAFPILSRFRSIVSGKKRKIYKKSRKGGRRSKQRRRTNKRNK